jgi:hypothetical protein
MHTDDKLNRYRPSPDALLNPCSDEVFKALFTNESDESRTALRCFLTAVLHKEVKNVELRPNEPPVIDDSDKAVRFDVSCTFNNGEAADVVTLTNKSKRRKRVPVLQMRSVTNIRLKSICIHTKVHGCTFVWLTACRNNGHLLSGIQTVIFLELPKIDVLGNVPPETLHSEEKCCKFLIDADNPSKQDYINKLTASDGGIMEAKKTLDKISSDWVLWKRELDREVIERDHNSELHYVKEQGTLQAKREDARNFKALGVPVQTIAQATGLSEDEIAGL